MYLFWSGLQRPSAAVARGVSGAGSGFRVGWRTVGGERLFLFFRSYLMVLPLAEGGGLGAGLGRVLGGLGPNFFFWGGRGGGPKHPCLLNYYLQWVCQAHLTNVAWFLQIIVLWGVPFYIFWFWWDCQSGVLVALGIWYIHLIGEDWLNVLYVLLLSV